MFYLFFLPYISVITHIFKINLHVADIRGIVQGYDGPELLRNSLIRKHKPHVHVSTGLS